MHADGRECRRKLVRIRENRGLMYKRVLSVLEKATDGEHRFPAYWQN